MTNLQNIDFFTEMQKACECLVTEADEQQLKLLTGIRYAIINNNVWSRNRKLYIFDLEKQQAQSTRRTKRHLLWYVISACVSTERRGERVKVCSKIHHKYRSWLLKAEEE